MGEAPGRAGVSIESGGPGWSMARCCAFSRCRRSAARTALESAGISVLAEREVLVQRLKQDVPGQLGMLTRRMAEAGVNIEVLYSDHEHRLILVVDDFVRFLVWLRARHVARLCEPFRTCLYPREMAGELRALGFAHVEVADSVESRSLSRGNDRLWMGPLSYIAHATGSGTTFADYRFLCRLSCVGMGAASPLFVPSQSVSCLSFSITAQCLAGRALQLNRH